MHASTQVSKQRKDINAQSFPIGPCVLHEPGPWTSPSIQEQMQAGHAQCMVLSRHWQVASVIDWLRPLGAWPKHHHPHVYSGWGRHSKPTFSGLTSQFPGAATVRIQDGPSIHGGWQSVLTSSSFSFLETEPVISEHLTLENSLLWWCHGNKNRLSPICTKQEQGVFDKHIETQSVVWYGDRLTKLAGRNFCLCRLPELIPSLWEP